MVTQQEIDNHPLVLFEKARALIGHKALIPTTHRRTMVRMFDSGAMPAQALFEYARYLRESLAGVDPLSETDATLPTVDVANLRLEADVCCAECRMFLELTPDFAFDDTSKSPWVFSLLGAHDCYCYERGDISQVEKDRVELLHDRLTEMEEEQR